MASPTPALTRGIRVLRLMEDGAPRSLEELAGALSVPKSSLSRILGTLVHEGVMARDPASRRYRLAQRLVPIGSAEPGFDERLAAALLRIAGRTACTAEWYVPVDGGLLLARQAEPPEAVVRVHARTGFMRCWAPELEAVSILGWAWFRSGAPAPRGLWAYTTDARRADLSEAEASERIASARDRGWAVDRELNANGVRRLAAVLTQDDRPAGVFALAQPVLAGVAEDVDNLLPELLTAAGALCAGPPAACRPAGKAK